jgi:plasmid stabilization system protein ParE
VKRARFLAEARRELLGEVAYYENQRKGVGAQFRRAVEKAASLAVAFPLAGSPCAAETRKIVVKGFPFFLVYRPEGTGIVVFAVVHTRRDPEYWLDRT